MVIKNKNEEEFHRGRIFKLHVRLNVSNKIEI